MANIITRWYKWKLSGIITVGLGAILLIVGLFYLQGQAEFFDSWSCETLIEYVQEDNSALGFPLHDEITDVQHNKIHVYIEECEDNNRFSVPINHLNP